MTTADHIDELGAHLVDVFASEKQGIAPRLFVAVMPRSTAVAAVRHCIPADQHAVLSRRVLDSDEISALGLRQGQVREIDV